MQGVKEELNPQDAGSSPPAAASGRARGNAAGPRVGSQGGHRSHLSAGCWRHRHNGGAASLAGVRGYHHQTGLFALGY